MNRPDFVSPRDFTLLQEKFSENDLPAAIARLAEREPLGYVLGEWYFRNETYTVTPDVLIPRPETEHLVDFIVRNCPKGGRIADLCTGSGCIAISSLCERPDIAAVALDVSEKALAIASRNAVRNGVDGRISFVKGDVLRGDPVGEKFDIIVSNPPYIRSDVIPTLEKEVLCEPTLALDGGEDGLIFYRAIIDNYTSSAADDGYLLFEIGYDQGEVLKRMGFTVLKDYSGNDRVAFRKL